MTTPMLSHANEFILEFPGIQDYENWEKLVRSFLESSGLWSYVDGTARPRESLSQYSNVDRYFDKKNQAFFEELRDFDLGDAKAKQVIISNCPPHVRQYVESTCLTAKELWDKLYKTRYQPEERESEQPAPIVDPAVMTVLYGVLNYKHWKLFAQLLFKAFGVWDEVHGISHLPPVDNHATSQAKKALVSTCVPSIRMILTTCTSLKQCWEVMESAFEVADVLESWKEFSLLSYSGMETLEEFITMYLTAVREMRVNFGLEIPEKIKILQFVSTLEHTQFQEWARVKRLKFRAEPLNLPSFDSLTIELAYEESRQQHLQAAEVAPMGEK